MQTSAKQQSVTTFTPPLEAYAQARTRIRSLLQINNENSKDLTRTLALMQSLKRNIPNGCTSMSASK